MVHAKRWIVLVLLPLVIGIVAILTTNLFSPFGRAAVLPVSYDQASGKIEPRLLEQLSDGQQADFILRFSEQADLSPAYAMSWEARGDFVYNTLFEVAQRSQQKARSYLDERGLAHRTFLAGNELYVWAGDLTALNELAALPEVAMIRATRLYSIGPVWGADLSQFSRIWVGDLIAENIRYTVETAPASSPQAVTDWGITDTKADQFWSMFSVQGDGIVVANIDTGVQWNHPALVNQFKCGSNPSDPACWSDPSNICGGSACDNNGHGTHTMGTMVADDNAALPYIAGMAPNAQWIACKGCESNSCSDAALSACADWVLAPAGNPANRPHIVNNSWGGDGGDAWYLPKVNAWLAAGIFPAFSAGNSGSGCNTLGSPGDYQESFATANHKSSRNISASSSRGPSPFGHDPYTKPNISAPGDNICSTVPTNQWNCGYSGTSMASPHSAGAVALLWSCNASLIGQIDTTIQLLQNSADAPPDGNCGAPPDGQGNYTFGYGYLNVLQAGITSCSQEAGYLEGHVFDASSGNPIEGASVTVMAGAATQGNIQTITDPNGFYSITLAPGVYTVTASKNGYSSETVPGVEITVDTVTTLDFDLTFQGLWTLGSGLCFDFTRYDAEYFPGTGKVYVLGGRVGNNTYGDIYALDPSTGGCVDTGANLSTPISNYTVNLLNDGSADLLCTFGGRKADANITLDVQCYNPVTNVAFVKTSLPTAYQGYIPGAQAVVDNQVYIFGGFRSGSAPYQITRTDRYDPLTNAFTQIGDLSLGRGYIMAAAVDGKIYAFGGATFNGVELIAQTRAEVMADPAGAGSWDDAAAADLPMASAEGRAFGLNSDAFFNRKGQIILAGGGQWPEDTTEALLYIVASNTYDPGFTDLNVSRRDHAGFLVPICSVASNDGLPGLWVSGGLSTAAGYGGDDPPYAPAEFFPLTCEPPDVQIGATSLTASLHPDTTQAMSFTLTNAGQSSLVWNITEMTTLMADVPWMSATPSSGTLSAGQTQPVTVTLDTAGLAVGEYQAGLEVNSNDPDEPSVTMPVNLTVFDRGVAVEPVEAVVLAEPGETVTHTLTISNTGIYSETFDLTMTGNEWPTVLSDSAITLDPGKSIEVTVAVTIPPTVLPGAKNEITLTISSQADGDINTSAGLTTMPLFGRLMLPFIMK